MTQPSSRSLDAEVATVSEIITSELAPNRRVAGKGGDPKDDLQLTGLEPVIAAIALKVVIGIASSFVGRMLYDKWKSARTRKHLERLADEIAANVNQQSQIIDSVNANAVRDDILGVLTLEGLSEAQANAVFDRAFALIKDRFNK